MTDCSLLIPYAILSIVVAIGVIFIFTEFYIVLFNDKLIKKTVTRICVGITNMVIIAAFIYAFVSQFKACMGVN